MAAQEDPIENRLLLGEAENRKLATLLPSFFKWANAPVDADTSLSLLKLKQQLAWLEFNVVKTEQILHMNEEEQRLYKELQGTIAQKIKESVAGIEQAKLELEDAKRIRLNRQEYDLRAEIILVQPSRQATIRTVRQVELDLEELKKESQALELQMEKRRKQHAFLMNAVRDLRLSLDEELRQEVSAAGAPELSEPDVAAGEAPADRHAGRDSESPSPEPASPRPLLEGDEQASPMEVEPRNHEDDGTVTSAAS